MDRKIFLRTWVLATILAFTFPGLFSCFIPPRHYMAQFSRNPELRTLEEFLQLLPKETIDTYSIGQPFDVSYNCEKIINMDSGKIMPSFAQELMNRFKWNKKYASTHDYFSIEAEIPNPIGLVPLNGDKMPKVRLEFIASKEGKRKTAIIVPPLMHPELDEFTTFKKILIEKYIVGRLLDNDWNVAVQLHPKLPGSPPKLINGKENGNYLVTGKNDNFADWLSRNNFGPYISYFRHAAETIKNILRDMKKTKEDEMAVIGVSYGGALTTLSWSSFNQFMVWHENGVKRHAPICTYPVAGGNIAYFFEETHSKLGGKARDEMMINLEFKKTSDLRKWIENSMPDYEHLIGSNTLVINSGVQFKDYSIPNHSQKIQTDKLDKNVFIAYFDGTLYIPTLKTGAREAGAHVATMASFALPEKAFDPLSYLTKESPLFFKYMNYHFNLIHKHLK